MTLIDPKSGAAVAYGEKIPSTAFTTVWNQQTKAFDAVGGGSWTLGSNATLSGTGIVSLNHLALPSGGSSTVDQDVTWQANNWPKLTAREVQRAIALGGPAGNANARFSYEGVSVFAHYQSNITDGGGLVFAINNIIPSSTLKRVVVYANGALNGAGHGGSPGVFPTTMPTFSLWACTGATATQIGTTRTLTAAGDFSSDAANYDTDFSVTVDNGGADIDLAIGANQLFSYFIKVTGEYNANSVVGFGITAIIPIYGVTQLIA